MADRSIKVTLRANVNDFKAQMAQASKSLEEVAKTGDSTGKVATSSLGKITQSALLQSAEWSKVSNSLLTAGAVGAAAFGGIVKVASNFEQQMSAVQAATLATSGEMDVLREAAKQAGADTVFSATEAAQGIEELAKAGVSTSDILGGGLTGALNLAAAGGISVSEAAEAAASAMTQFKLEGSDVTHIADLLAAGAGKAQGGVSDLAMALSQAGVVASGAGLTIEDTVGTLTAFASAGLLGSDAGTSFKSMLQRLQNPSKESKTLMDELGISLYDTSGNVVTMSNLAGQLQTALGGMTSAQRDAALAQIFGSDAVRAANILYQQGADGIAKWTDEVDAAGYAQQVATARMDNLAGAWEQFSGSAETLAITLGEKLLPTLTDLVNGATDAINWIAGLPDPVLNAALAFGGLVTVGSLVVGGAAKLVTSVISIKSAYTSLSTPIRTATTSVGRFITKAGMVAAVAVPVVEGLAAISRIGDKTASSLDKTRASLGDLDSLFSGIGDDYDDMAGALEILLGDSFNSKMERFGHGLNGLFGERFSDQVKDAKEQFETIGEALSNMVDEGDASGAAKVFNEVAAAAEKQGISIDEVMGLMPAYSDALARNGTEAEGAADSNDDAAGTVNAVEEAADAASDAIDEYVQGLEDAAGIAMSADEAQASWAQQTRDNTEALQELTGYTDDAGELVEGLGSAVTASGDAWDLYTDAGQLANQTMLDTSQKAWDLVEALYNEQGASADLEGAMASGRDEFIRTATQMGLTQEAAEALADEYGLVPETVRTEVIAETSAATSGLTYVQQLLASLDGQTSTVVIRQVYQEIARNDSSYSSGSTSMGRTTAYATGGPIPGYGGGDIVPTMLEPGEYVVNKVAASQNRDLLDQLNFGSAQHLASGGPVAYVPASSMTRQTTQVVTKVVEVPTSLTVVDVDRKLTTTMQVVADERAAVWWKG